MDWNDTEQVRNYRREYRKKNRERLLKLQHAWNVANKEYRKEYDRRWRMGNPEKYRAKARKSDASRRDSNLQRLKKWVADNPERAKQSTARASRSWRLANMDRVKDSTWYIRNLVLKMKVCPPDLISCKRVQLQICRFIKGKKLWQELKT